jgi:hypothetical protein
MSQGLLRWGDAMAHKPDTLEELFPSRERGTTPTSLRLSSAILARIDVIARERKVTRTAAVERLLAFALDEIEGTESVEELQARRRRSGNVRVSVAGKKK